MVKYLKNLQDVFLFKDDMMEFIVEPYEYMFKHIVFTKTYRSTKKNTDSVP